MSTRRMTVVEWLTSQHLRHHPHCTYGTAYHWVQPADGQPGRFLCEPEPPDANPVDAVPSPA